DTADSDYMYAEYHFFFQAGDGIRDGHVTGVQTCALPISWSNFSGVALAREVTPGTICKGNGTLLVICEAPAMGGTLMQHQPMLRSEERRVGKECRFRG